MNEGSSAAGRPRRVQFRYEHGGFELVSGATWVQAVTTNPPQVYLGYLLSRDDAIVRVQHDIYLSLQLYPALESDGPEMFSVCPTGHVPEQILLPLRACDHVTSLWPVLEIDEPTGALHLR